MTQTDFTRALVASTLALVACRTQGASTVAPPSPVVAAPAATPDAAVVAAPAGDPRRDAVLAAWRAANPSSSDAPTLLGEPIDHPDDGAAGVRVAAVVASDTSATLVVTPVPFAAGMAATASIMLSAPPAEAIAGLSSRDINGDHRRDVAVFLRTEYALEDYLPMQRFALLYTLNTDPERTLPLMVRHTMQLLGVRDDASLAAALPGLDTYEAPAAGMSHVRFLARLRYATPEQFRAAVASTGLRLCTDLPDRTGNRRKRCVTHPVARITDAMITGRIRSALGEFCELGLDSPNGLTEPSCQRAGREVHCNANEGGPSGVDWSLVGEGASMRIIEISPWAESS